MAAKRLEPETAKPVIAAIPALIPESAGVQLAPLLPETKTCPALVPAKSFEPETAKAWTVLSVRPVLIAIQFAPLFVERKMP